VSSDVVLGLVFISELIWMDGPRRVWLSSSLQVLFPRTFTPSFITKITVVHNTEFLDRMGGGKGKYKKRDEKGYVTVKVNTTTTKVVSSSCQVVATPTTRAMNAIQLLHAIQCDRIYHEAHDAPAC